MSAEAFVDTNVLLYLLSKDVAKADRAEQILRSVPHISVQILNEIANVLRRKFGLSWPETQQFLAGVRAICPLPQPVTIDTHERALLISERYGLSVYDAMVVAAALHAGCTTLYSEDMQSGLRIDETLVIVNPFVALRPIITG